MQLPVAVVGQYVYAGEFASFVRLMELLRDETHEVAFKRLFDAGYRVYRMPAPPVVVEGEVVGEG